MLRLYPQTTRKGTDVSTDAHYATGSGFNAHGSQIPDDRDLACREILAQGFSAVFECSLFTGHTGPHESFGGTSWDHEPGSSVSVPSTPEGGER